MTRKEPPDQILELPEVRAVLYGAGSIGSSIARLLLIKEGIKIVGAIDAAPSKAGRDLGELIGAGEALGVIVSDSPDRLLSEVKADIAVHATSSFLKDVCPQLAELVQHKVNVVSTCEELAYPYVSDAKLAAELDELARTYGVTVLGTGINPGFLMDTLAIALTGVCQEVEHIKVERVIDAGKRRTPFQKKIGAGLTLEEFREQMEKKAITGHVGLKQSIAMIADALRWDLERIEVGSVEPVIAGDHVESSTLEVEIGQAAGLSQTALGIMNGGPVITLVFRAYTGADEEYDSISIEGTPSIHEKIKPCVHGDLATAAIVVNSIPKVMKATSGLKTMMDLPIPSAAIRDIRAYL